MQFLRLLTLATTTSLTLIGPCEAKSPGHEYCFYKTCHRVKSLEETRRLIGVPTTLKASYYDDAGHDRYNPSNMTSSGEYFRSNRPDNAASPIYPDGTKLLVWHPRSGKALEIRVNNAGPYWGDRTLDLSRAAAELFGFTDRGVATVHVRVLEAPTKAEATYRRGRTYPKVRGYLGRFASAEAALGNTDQGATRLAAAGHAPAPAVPPNTTVAEAATTPAPVADAAPTLAVTASPVSSMPVGNTGTADRGDVPAVSDERGQPRVKLASTSRRSNSTPVFDFGIATSAAAEAKKYLVAQRTVRTTAVVYR